MFNFLFLFVLPLYCLSFELLLLINRKAFCSKCKDYITLYCPKNHVIKFVELIGRMAEGRIKTNISSVHKTVTENIRLFWVFLQFVQRDRLEPRSGQTINYSIGICCFSTQH